MEFTGLHDCIARRERDASREHSSPPQDKGKETREKEEEHEGVSRRVGSTTRALTSGPNNSSHGDTPEAADAETT